MKRFWLVVAAGFAIALLLTACSPLMNPDEAKAARDEVDAALAAGTITEQQAEWRREDIARMEAFHAFDIGSFEAIAGIILTTLLGNQGLTRWSRGAPKPIPKSAVPAFQTTVVKAANGG